MGQRFTMSGPEDQAGRSADVIKLKIVPVSSFYSERDPRYESESFELQQLIRQMLPRELEIRSAPGTKGLDPNLIVTIATSGAMAALIQAIQAWISRKSNDRKIKLESTEESGKERKVSLSIEASDLESKDIASIISDAFGTKK